MALFWMLLLMASYNSLRLRGFHFTLAIPSSISNSTMWGYKINLFYHSTLIIYFKYTGLYRVKPLCIMNMSFPAILLVPKTAHIKFIIKANALLITELCSCVIYSEFLALIQNIPRIIVWVENGKGNMLVLEHEVAVTYPCWHLPSEP